MAEAEQDRQVADVEALHVYLGRGLRDDGTIAHHRAYVRNVAYSLQYVDYLLGELEHGDLRLTLHSQACKSVIVVGMGVVEALLWYFLRQAGAASTSQWEVAQKLTSPVFSHGGQEQRIINVIERKLPAPVLEEMTLDAMVKRAEARSILGSLDHAVYGHLRTLRKLRNRVHIHSVQDDADTDWFSFTGREVGLLLNALRSILSLQMFSPTPDRLELLSFLDPRRVERRR